jgi:6,7-dimethyl-8-ribityllumazine synthase
MDEIYDVPYTISMMRTASGHSVAYVGRVCRGNTTKPEYIKDSHTHTHTHTQIHIPIYIYVFIHVTTSHLSWQRFSITKYYIILPLAMWALEAEGNEQKRFIEDHAY